MWQLACLKTLGMVTMGKGRADYILVLFWIPEGLCALILPKLKSKGLWS